MLECNFCSWQGLKSDLQKNKHCPKCSSPNVKQIINTMTNKVPTTETILDKHIINRFDETDRLTFIKAMEDYKNQCLEDFAEDVKENGRPFIINDKINDVIMIRKSSIDEIKQKHIDKL